METITNAAQAASKYVFGEETDKSGTEPTSGETGKGTVNEPYDAGNKEGEPQNESGLPSSEQKAPEQPKSPPIDSSADSKAPSEQQPVQKPEEGDRPVDEPLSAEEEEKERGEKALANKDPNDHSGEPLKIHDGGEKKEGEGSELPEDDKKDDKDDKDGKDDKNDNSKGTGEKWVKTSGLAADGGDFDATKPGAGREADRLMEEKGIHKSEPGKPAPIEPSPSGTKEKQSMSQKIKDKLHIGSGKHS